MARLSDLQFSRDAAQAEDKRRIEVEVRDLARVKATRVYAKPIERRGKAYHRAETSGNENARKDAEQKEHEKWAKKVLRILVNADLLFGVEAFETGSP